MSHDDSDEEGISLHVDEGGDAVPDADAQYVQQQQEEPAHEEKRVLSQQEAERTEMMLVVLCAASTAIYCDRGLITGSLLEVVADLGIASPLEVAQLAALYTGMMLAAGLPVAYRSRHRSPLPPLLYAMVLCGVGAMLAARGGRDAFWTARALMGAGDGMFIMLQVPCMRMLAASLDAPGEQTVTDRWIGIASFSPLGMLIGYAAALLGVSWRAACAANAAAFVLLFAVMPWHTRNTGARWLLHEAAIPRAAPAGVLALLRRRRLWLVVVANSALQFSVGALLYWGLYLFKPLVADMTQRWALLAQLVIPLVLANGIVGGVLLLRLLQRLASIERNPSRQRAAILLAFGVLLALTLPGAYLAVDTLPALAAACFLGVAAALFGSMQPLNQMISEEYGFAVWPYAVSVCAFHAFGDWLSPAVVGFASNYMSLGSALVCSTLTLPLYLGAVCVYWKTLEPPANARIDEFVVVEPNADAAADLQHHTVALLDDDGTHEM